MHHRKPHGHAGGCMLSITIGIRKLHMPPWVRSLVRGYVPARGGGVDDRGWQVFYL